MEQLSPFTDRIAQAFFGANHLQRLEEQFLRLNAPVTKISRRYTPVQEVLELCLQQNNVSAIIQLVQLTSSEIEALFSTVHEIPASILFSVSKTSTGATHVILQVISHLQQLAESEDYDESRSIVSRGYIAYMLSNLNLLKVIKNAAELRAVVSQIEAEKYTDTLKSFELANFANDT